MICQDCKKRDARYHRDGDLCGSCYKRRRRGREPEFAERDRETSQRWKDENRELKRAYDREYAVRVGPKCERCGKQRHRRHGGAGPLCGECISADARAGEDRIVELYAEGVPLVDIAADLGTSRNAISVDVDRLRKAGRVGYRYKAYEGRAA